MARPEARISLEALPKPPGVDKVLNKTEKREQRERSNRMAENKARRQALKEETQRDLEARKEATINELTNHGDAVWQALNTLGVGWKGMNTALLRAVGRSESDLEFVADIQRAAGVNPDKKIGPRSILAIADALGIVLTAEKLKELGAVAPENSEVAGLIANRELQAMLETPAQARQLYAKACKEKGLTIGEEELTLFTDVWPLIQNELDGLEYANWVDAFAFSEALSNDQLLRFAIGPDALTVRISAKKMQAEAAESFAFSKKEKRVYDTLVSIYGSEKITKKAFIKIKDAFVPLIEDRKVKDKDHVRAQLVKAAGNQIPYEDFMALLRPDEVQKEAEEELEKLTENELMVFNKYLHLISVNGLSVKGFNSFKEPLMARINMGQINNDDYLLGLLYTMSLEGHFTQTSWDRYVSVENKRRGRQYAIQNKLIPEPPEDIADGNERKVYDLYVKLLGPDRLSVGGFNSFKDALVPWVNFKTYNKLPSATQKEDYLLGQLYKVVSNGGLSRESWDHFMTENEKKRGISYAKTYLGLKE